MDGIGIADAWVSVHLSGNGSLRADGAPGAQRLTFQRTDESGTILFVWLPDTHVQPAPIEFRASSARGALLVIRQL
ncbi:MAG: hypothetical protein O2888_03960 [Chloroflexi bacterium]|nr:hypothetical protein [Chloroflexota bacterium]